MCDLRTKSSYREEVRRSEILTSNGRWAYMSSNTYTGIHICSKQHSKIIRPHTLLQSFSLDAPRYSCIKFLQVLVGCWPATKLALLPLVLPSSRSLQLAFFVVGHGQQLCCLFLPFTLLVRSSALQLVLELVSNHPELQRLLAAGL